MIIKFDIQQDTGDSQKQVIETLSSFLRSKKDFEVEFKVKNNNKIQSINPNIFYFQEVNKTNLMNVRANVGKEIDRRLKSGNFEDFQVSFAMATKPNDEQRGYYFGIVIPTIQEYFKNEGNFIKIDDLHESLKRIISENYGLKIEKINKITGEVYNADLTISNAGNRKDVARYIDAVIKWASEYGIIIPEPTK